jgi:magnesium chelatase subunit D
VSCSEFIGHDDAKRALILNALDPRCGGALFIGEKGCGKSTIARSLRTILPFGTPFIELPLNVTEDALIGSVAIEDTLKTGERVFQEGVLARAHGGVLFIDDVNLLPAEIVSLVLDVQGRGENIVEREGLTIRHPAAFIFVASMCPVEGGLSPHLLDRFGMCVCLEGLKEPEQRISVIRYALNDRPSVKDLALAEKIDNARSLLAQISVSDRMLEYIADICLSYNVAGHRADLYMLAAARAQAALHGSKEVTRDDIDSIAPLVLIHRRRELQPPPPPEQEQERENPDQNQEQQDNRQDEQKQQQPEQDQTPETAPPKPQQAPKEDEVFEVGKTFKVKRLIFRKDRIERSASGRRTSTRTKNRGGRYLKSVMRENPDIAIDATLRAAAPFQRGRNRQDVVVIKEEDFRYKSRERKMGHVAIFVVDGSGSMGARKRMVAAKGAAQALLMDCYQKRDMVSMIVFRKDHAEVVLQPTASVEHAARRLREIPVGGKTPLGAGLLEAYNLMARIGRKKSETRFLIVLITDGRSNQAISDMPPDEEISRISALLREQPGLDIIVVDTEEKGRFVTTDRAATVAALLNAEYYPIDDLKADTLTFLVMDKKETLAI